MKPTQAELKELFDYDPETGAFTWKKARGSRAKAGAPVGSLVEKGYRQARIGYWTGPVHHLIWVWYYGVWPEGRIRHKDRNNSNNRIENLHDVPSVMLLREMGISSRNKSGYLGVSWAAHCGKWAAHICAFGKRKHLGLFDAPEAAAEAYQAAKRELHGQEKEWH